MTAQPRFCVIGPDGYGIGIGGGMELEGRFVEKPSRNETSILAILYWLKNRRCSYYTGGDGSPQVAKEIVTQWLSKPEQFERDGQVDLMKLDHHGSTKENLVSKKKPVADTNSIFAGDAKKADKKSSDIITDILINKLRPQGLLVTPGTQHVHPTWDVLLAIHKYFSMLGETDGLFTTRSFYWLDTNKPHSIKNLNFNHNEIEYMQAFYKEVYKSYSPDALVSIDDVEVISTREIEIVQTVYEKVYDVYCTGNEHEDEGDEVTMHDLIVLDQPARVEYQAEFEKEKKKYGNRLKAKASLYERTGQKDILKKNDRIDWSKIQELLTKECQSLLQTKTEKIDHAIEKSLVGSDLFWAWFSWAEDVEDSVFDGALQYSHICWQPIITVGHPHYLVSFVFGNDGEDKSIEVFTDDGEFQVIKNQHDGTASHVATDLVVEHQSAPWTKLVYSPLTLATMFDLQDPVAQAEFKDEPMLKQPLLGIKNHMKLAIEVLFNTNPVNSTSSKPSSRKEIKSAKMRVVRLEKTIEKDIELTLNGQGMIGMSFKKQEWLLQNRPKRAKKSNPFLAVEESGELIARNCSALLGLTSKDLNGALKHDMICYFAWHCTPEVRETIREVQGKNYDGGSEVDKEKLGAMLSDVDFKLSNFEPEGIFKYGKVDQRKK